MKKRLSKQYAWCHDSIYITPREVEVIYHITNGRTAKESAVLMNISFRTVQVYIEKIKQKLQCSRKNEIFNKINIVEFFQHYNLNS